MRDLQPGWSAGSPSLRWNPLNPRNHMKLLIVLLLATLALIGVASKLTSHQEPPPPSGVTPDGGGRLGDSPLER